MALAILSASLRAAGSWGRSALDLAFPWQESGESPPVPIIPPFCRQCGYPHPALDGLDSTYVCGRCAQRRWYFQWARAAYRTDGQVREAVLGFKYGHQYYRYDQLVGWLTEAFDRHAAPEGFDALVPVPLHHLRRRDRGFNQAREIAYGLAQRTKVPLLDCLYRYRDTGSQTRLDREARWDNMAKAFALKRGFDVKALHLLLIDDVFTTGATANACARVLAKAGAGRLAVLTIARS